jgi:BirA family transcriptional regulator, biotin operon repressor / biotin---[acetyl-CoA-carboxylase] ligase
LLILTDLADWKQDPLDSLADGRPVKSLLAGAELSAAALLRAAFPTGARPVALRSRPGPAADGWLALALADRTSASQYDVLLAAARRTASLPGPLAALALCGEGMHGNRGRCWLAARGNLHLSCALPVDLDLAGAAPAVPALAAVAVCDALARCAPGLVPRLKWANDVLLGGAKTAGVLSAAQTRGPRLLALVFGIGLNVAVAPAVPPSVFVPRVTCLHDHAAGRQATLGAVTIAVLEALQARVGQLAAAGAAPLVAAYREACGDLGRRVAVWPEGQPDAARRADLPSPLVEGRVLALGEDLSLHVEGAAAPLTGGRLAPLDGPAPATEPGP